MTIRVTNSLLVSLRKQKTIFIVSCYGGYTKPKEYHINPFFLQSRQLKLLGWLIICRSRIGIIFYFLIQIDPRGPLLSQKYKAMSSSTDQNII